MSNRPVPATAEGMPADLVADLARRLAAARQREEALDLKGTAASRRKDTTQEIYFKSAGRHAADEVNCLRDLIASTEAQSLLGAAAQLADAIGRNDYLRPADDHPDGRAIERLLFSVLRVIEGHIGSTLEDAFGFDLASRNLDPWAPVEARLEKIGAELATEGNAR